MVDSIRRMQEEAKALQQAENQARVYLTIIEYAKKGKGAVPFGTIEVLPETREALIRDGFHITHSETESSPCIYWQP